MTLDHVNRFIFYGTIYPFFCIGRLAFPLFAFVFAYHFAQLEEFKPLHYQKMALRAVLFGSIAMFPYMAMFQFQQIFPLNILFTFLLVVICLYLYQKFGQEIMYSFAVFTVGGYFVDYFWFGIAFCLSSVYFCKKFGSLVSLGYFLITLLSLYIVNQNYWALAVLPLIYAAPYVNIPIPRIRYLFWVYYPLHLWLLFAVSYFNHLL